jgi:hypothetical protein
METTEQTQTTVGSVLADQGVLVIAKRYHLLREDLSGVSLCGRWRVGALSNSELERQLLGLPPLCGVCESIRDHTTSIERRG